MRLLLIGAFLIHVAAFSAEPQRPPSGQHVNERKDVALRTAVSAPCLAFPMHGATVLLQKSELEELARAVHEGPPTADSGMVQLNRERARDLLRGYFTEGEVKGCALARAVPGDGSWLILRQIELGQAAIVAAGELEFAPRASVHYSGAVSDRLGSGFISVYLAGGLRPIYSLPWWIT